jgi:hypothetical protein
MDGYFGKRDAISGRIRLVIRAIILSRLTDCPTIIASFSKIALYSIGRQGVDPS